MEDLFSLSDNQSTNKVIRLVVRQSFDVQIDLSLRLRKTRSAVDISSVLTNGERLQCKVVRRRGILWSLGRSAGPESVRQLRDGEYPLAAMALAFGFGDA